MIGYIVKRDGRKVAFNRNKIANAIKKSMISAHSEEQGYVVDQDLIDSLTDEVVLQIEDRDDVVPTVENTQDVIERVLIKRNLSDEAKNFILYRQQRTNVRTYNADLTKIS